MESRSAADARFAYRSSGVTEWPDFSLDWTGSSQFSLVPMATSLAPRAKSHPAKLALAARLRRETTLSVKEITGRLNLGKPKGARTNLHGYLNHTQPAGSQA